MTAYLLDTNHAGALMKDDPRMISALRAQNENTFHVAMPSVGELWYMVYNSSRIEANARKLRNLLRVVVVLPFDPPTTTSGSAKSSRYLEANWPRAFRVS